MAEDDVVDDLMEIGLTEYQSRAYVAAVTLGTADFSSVAEESGIPRQRIYDVIYSLEDLGLVEVHEGGNGKEVAAPPPETVLEELRDRRLDEVALQFDRLKEGLQQEYSQVERTRGFVTVVRHQSSVRRHVRSAVEAAGWWLFLSLDVDTYEAVVEEVREAMDRDVSVRLLLHVGEPRDLPDVALPEGLEVRRRPSADTLVAADRDYGVFRGVAAPTVRRPTLVTRDENVVEMLQRYSQQFWTASESVRTTEGFPRRYLSPWQAIVDVRRAGIPADALRLRVEGHATETGRRGTWAGDLLDYELRAHEESDFAVTLPEVARLTIDADGETVTVGGWDATLEDVAAHGIEIDRG